MAARGLAHSRGVQVTLIDKRNHHLFQPLLYQVATAALSPADVAMPVRAIFSRSSQVHTVLSEVTAIDTAKRVVRTREADVPYDFLIVASGSDQSYFGKNDWEEFAPGLKSLEQATEIRRRMLLAIELAVKEDDPVRRKALLTFLVVGGGPTGVELAGALGEISRYTLARDFRRIDPSQTRIILVDAGKRILAGFDEKLSRRAARDLEELGVQIWYESRVSDIGRGYVSIGSEKVEVETVLWAAGVEPSPLARFLDAPLDRTGRVKVNPDLSLPGDASVFVVGDLAYLEDAQGQPLPGLAPLAMQQGKHAARSIVRAIAGKTTQPFKYWDKGMVATIGRRKAVVQIGGFRLAGFAAWVMWIGIHIYYLIGFRNKLIVLLQWIWSYVTFKKGARLIVEKEWRSHQGSKP